PPALFPPADCGASCADGVRSSLEARVESLASVATVLPARAAPPPGAPPPRALDRGRNARQTPAPAPQPIPSQPPAAGPAVPKRMVSACHRPTTVRSTGALPTPPG